MSENDPFQPLRAAAMAALTALGEDAGRLLGAEPTPAGGVQLHVASDGLDLARKLELEKGLRAHIEDEAARLGLPVSVYFRRRNAAPAGGPAPLARKTSAFGLTIDKRAIPGVTEIVVVASGKGGVGKSTVSANLAVALAQGGAKVGLLDADIYGPSAPMMMGVKGVMPVQAGERLVPLEANGVKLASFGFLTDVQQPVIWRGPLVAKALKQLCYDVAWGDLDYLVIDLPPGTGDVQLALIESVPIHAAVIVTTPQDVALLDAHKALTMFERLDVPVLGLIENMAYFRCTSCGHEDHVFGEGGGERMARERKLEVIARVPLAGAVRARGDEGRPVALAGADDPLAAPFHALAARVRRGR